MVASGAAPVKLSTINDVNNWLGRSQWGDPMFQGAFNEFRVYNNALNPIEVAASYYSGADKPGTAVSSLGTLKAIHLTVAKTTLTQFDKTSATASVDFAKVSGLSLTAIPGVTFESDNANVLTVTQAGAIEAVAAGTANVKVTYEGSSDTVAVTVNARPQALAVAGEIVCRSARLGIQGGDEYLDQQNRFGRLLDIWRSVPRIQCRRNLHFGNSV